MNSDSDLAAHSSQLIAQGLQPQPHVSTRAAREHKLRRLKLAVGAAGLAGMGLFSGLAAVNTHAGGSNGAHASSPDQQVTSLENAQGGSFFSIGGAGAAPPSASSSPPQTSSGGS